MTKYNVSNRLDSDLSLGFFSNFEIVSDFDIRISNLDRRTKSPSPRIIETLVQAAGAMMEK
jgi:hypothetical protein